LADGMWVVVVMHHRRSSASKSSDNIVLRYRPPLPRSTRSSMALTVGRLTISIESRWWR
jgi:hypothetical protein